MTSISIRLAPALLALLLASSAQAGGGRLVATSVVGCVDRALIARADWLRADPAHDYDRLLRAAIGAGQCRTLDAGTTVVAQGSDILGGLVRVRPVGEPQAVWIGAGALAAE